jgi:regulation of enolase protein 1 (concanavalin A-like superfamily)
MYIQHSNQWLCYASFEMRSKGVVVRGWKNEDGTLDEAKPAYLRLTRKGKEILAAVSQDGKAWRELPALEANLPKKVKIGVMALQNTPSGYEAILEDFKLTKPSP